MQWINLLFLKYMNITINQSACIECGTCKAICPLVFDTNEDGKAYVLKEANLDDSKECIENAIKMCPAQAISLEIN